MLSQDTLFLSDDSFFSPYRVFGVTEVFNEVLGNSYPHLIATYQKCPEETCDGQHYVYRYFPDFFIYFQILLPSHLRGCVRFENCVLVSEIRNPTRPRLYRPLRVPHRHMITDHHQLASVPATFGKCLIHRLYLIMLGNPNCGNSWK